MPKKIVCFGELLLRLSSPRSERLLQRDALNVHCAGAEANVAVSLARFGHQAEMVSVLPEQSLADHLIQSLRAQNVETEHIYPAPGRVGLYFLELGAVKRPSRIVYDRAHSSFCELDPETLDWPNILSGADILHISGITPALGPNVSEAAWDAAQTAVEMGVRFSFDGNYRAGLWKNWPADGPKILRTLVSKAALAFINERDIALLLGTDIETREEAISRAFDAFPKLERIAATQRSQDSVTNQSLTGQLYTRDQTWISATQHMPGVIDRIGGGDAFAAGLLHGILEGYDPQRTIDFATAASVIKHSIFGDWNLTRVEEIEGLLAPGGMDVRR